jgi:hypothetical protein
VPDWTDANGKREPDAPCGTQPLTCLFRGQLRNAQLQKKSVKRLKRLSRAQNYPCSQTFRPSSKGA